VHRRARRTEPVPTRTILATIGLVLAAMLLLLAVARTRRVLVRIVIALFFAVVLSPPWTGSNGA
jgi:predicted PurR-regulated permease PerM